jgi:formyltetrahydrofolate synthetase
VKWNTLPFRGSLLDIMATMPGLSTRPGYYEMDLDPDTGRVIGLS